LPLPTPYNLDETEQPYNAAAQVNDGPGYTFEFCDINSQLYFANTLTAPVPSTPFSATAWYFTNGGTPTQDVYTFAFSVDLNQWLTQTPVATVNGAPWTSPSSIVPTTGNVVITAKPQIAGYGEFIGWFQAGSGLNPSPTLTRPPAATSKPSRSTSTSAQLPERSKKTPTGACSISPAL
jgi:hypothetical protein